MDSSTVWLVLVVVLMAAGLMCGAAMWHRRKSPAIESARNQAMRRLHRDAKVRKGALPPDRPPDR
jgi:H+/Cl- antiporter ClcA